MMSDYAVELINDGMNEFDVEFHGPKQRLLRDLCSFYRGLDLIPVSSVPEIWEKWVPLEAIHRLLRKEKAMHMSNHCTEVFISRNPFGRSSCGIQSKSINSTTRASWE